MLFCGWFSWDGSYFWLYLCCLHSPRRENHRVHANGHWLNWCVRARVCVCVRVRVCVFLCQPVNECACVCVQICWGGVGEYFVWAFVRVWSPCVLVYVHGVLTCTQHINECESINVHTKWFSTTCRFKLHFHTCCRTRFSTSQHRKMAKYLQESMTCGRSRFFCSFPNINGGCLDVRLFGKMIKIEIVK